MDKQELEKLILQNARISADKYFKSEYLNEKIIENSKTFGNTNPNVVHRAYQAETLKIMSEAIAQTLIDLKMVSVDSHDDN